MKKVLKITGISLLALLILALLVPVLFKKQITALVKKEINNNLVATVDFNDVSLSLFRHFPQVSISIKDLTVVGDGFFANDTLLATKALDAAVNIISVIKGSNIKVSNVYLESPRIRALVNKDGLANWDIAKPSTDATTDTAATASAFNLSLKSYSIKDGYIQYKDETSGINTFIEGLNHKGSGNFSATIFTLSTSTKAAAASFTYEGIPYLVNTKTTIDADIEVDTEQSKYVFKTDDIKLNNLQLSANGFFQLVNDSTYGMDINFRSPSNDFKDILSMIPAVYKNDFDKIKTSGKALFQGFVKGIYSPQQLPAYDVKLNVQDASFQYPDLPKPVKNIQIDLQASNPDGKMDNTVIHLSKGHLEMDNEPFDFRFLFKHPETAQYIDAAVKGKLDLSQVTQFVKLEDNTKLAGLVWADAFAKGNMSALTNQQGPFTAGGFLDIKNLFYSSALFPQPLQNGTMKIQLTNNGGIADNTTVDITSGHIEVGKDPIDFSLLVSKPMTAINFTGAAKGQFTLDNVKQFTTFEPGTTLAGLLQADVKFAGTKTAIDKEEYDKINTTGTASLSNVKYVSNDYPGGISVPVVNASFNPKNVSISQFSGNYLNSNFTGNGSIDNLIGYALKDEALKGTLSVTVDKMNLNQWMGTAETPATEETTTSNSSTTDPFLVPANLHMTLNAKAGSLTYDKVEYKNIQGSLLLADQTVRLQNMRLDALEGNITLNGTYSTKVNKKEPVITLSYDVNDLDIQKTFLAFNTVKALMPIGQFLDGKLSSALSVFGNLNGNMMPDLSSLTGKGNLLLLEGVLRKFAPLEKIASTLQINELKEITIKDIKNSIEFANGKVLVKPFTVKVKDIEMQIGGTHGLDQTIDYIVAMKLPRKYLGTQGNTLINNLASQASSKGIPVNLGETVNLNIKLGGAIANPTIKTDLKEVAGDAVEDLKQQATEFAQAKIDSAKNTLKDSVTAIKNQVVNDLKDEVKNSLFGNKDSVNKTNLDSTKKNAEKTIKNTINTLLNKKKKDTDTTGKQ